MALRSIVVGSGRRILNMKAYDLMNPIYRNRTHNKLGLGLGLGLGFGHNNNRYSYYSTTTAADDYDYDYDDYHLQPDDYLLPSDERIAKIHARMHPEVLHGLQNMRCGEIRNHSKAQFEKEGRIMESAHFALNKHNEDQIDHLEFVRVVEAKSKKVAGAIFYITLEAKDALDGKLNMYHAVVWDKPWMKFKELQQWKPVDQTSSTDAMLHN